MDLRRRLALLEEKMEPRLRRQAEIEEAWQFRYRLWREHGFPRLPPPTEALTRAQFKAAYRQAYDPSLRPPRRPRNLGDAPSS